MLYDILMCKRAGFIFHKLTFSRLIKPDVTGRIINVNKSFCYLLVFVFYA